MLPLHYDGLPLLRVLPRETELASRTVAQRQRTPSRYRATRMEERVDRMLQAGTSAGAAPTKRRATATRFASAPHDAPANAHRWAPLACHPTGIASSCLDFDKPFTIESSTCCGNPFGRSLWTEATTAGVA